jgi:citrate synthase
VKFKDGILPQMDPNLGWAANYGVILGYEDTKFHELMRLYMFLHCDHEGGNVSAHATHLVGSALSDPYISFAAGVNGLAGPLHGAANAETLKFLLEIVNVYGPHPTKQQVIEFVHDILDGGRVIPGYGHAVLKKTDPRFTSQAKFAREYLPEDPMCRLVAICYEVIPQILMDTGKVANPWPNVDAHSGALLHHFGLVQFDYFTVLFAVSRSIGCMCNLILDRYLGLPIERPKSVTFERLEEDISNAAI